MPKLVLKFENSILREVPVGAKEVSIGRSPENGIVIDNPAVSHFHARVFNEEGRIMLEDFGSLNGTFVNGQRVKMVTLKAGDSVAIGKHTIVISDSRDLDGFATGNGNEKPVAAAPKLNETVLMKMHLLTAPHLALSFRTIPADLIVPERSVTCVRPCAAAPVRVPCRTSRAASPLPGSVIPVE